MSSTSDYRVGVTIGEGSYGRVVHARHKTSGNDVAIKIVDKLSLKKRPQLFDCVWTERTLLSQWNSEYVVKLWAAFDDAECLYFVMPCLTGGDLTHAVREGLALGNSASMNWTRAVPHYGLQILTALEYVHSQGFIHADLKPDNVLVSSRGRIQLADFGSAVSIRRGEKEESKEQNHAPVVGTADYASPEVLRGAAAEDLSMAVDLWSFGCILYACWVGQSPFHDKSDALAIQSVLDYSNHETTTADAIPEIVRTNVKNLSWQELIAGLLHPDPARRIGVSDVARNDVENVLYSSIRCKAVWDGVDLSQDPPFVPSPPQWWVQAQETPMRDGAKGWGAFLL